MTTHDRLFIDGRWAAPAGDGVLRVNCPHDGRTVGSAPEGTPADIDLAVDAARRAADSGPWPRTSPAERAAALGRLAEAFGRRTGDLAELITAEMGSPLSFSQLAQAPLAHAVLEYYAGLADQVDWGDVRPGLLGPVHVEREPAGVAAAIVPWNVPQFLIAAKIAPALLAGCTVVVKPAPETPLDPYLLAEAAQEADLPPGVLNIVAGGRETGEHLVAHPGVDHVAFTGSTAAGRRIGALCGERLKGCSLELGGKSAAVILDDADLDAYLAMLPLTALLNNGEACIAQARVLAPRARYDEVVEAVSEKVASLRVGDPADPATEVGPLVSERQRERVEGYIALGLKEGARITTGGGRPKGGGRDRGFYVEPTVFADAGNDMRIAREEIFGPVVVVVPYDGEGPEGDDEAVRLADDSEYGLAGSVWTSDPERGLAVARRVRAGTFGVNAYNIDVNTPFGGRKASGVGSEFGPEGLDEYLRWKSIPTLG
ncbi:aldehyde dehydrogenase [Nocardiopsis sp. RSe5-2]|uniref:aldehyde dehydrogenase (NAD(+)) n=1 Tax=Nocardiopsis endophytica TaxID=3018445 RepID=A0ABT4U2M2_9ACTN|nr:aldehyde dehydrogenase [Nocardiopsis endophytica]MDA2810710.1 aldehyde dehydrogenase [Nocardiopsis endophytica]